ncbi:MAG: N-acetylmuramoyl-L-alanine amidase [Christensenella sp.]
MEINDYGLQFKGALVPRKSTVRIILHHTEGGDAETVQGIHAYHLSRGHKGIDYNICVERDGTVSNGRGMEYCGGSVNNSNAATRGMNDDSVAIAALGNFEQNEMPEVQKEALKRIAREVAACYGTTEVVGHNEVAGRDYTTCPGKYFPIDEIRDYVRGAQLETPTPAPPQEPASDIPELTRNLRRGDRGEDVRQAQERLNIHNAGAGAEDGIFGTRTKEAVMRFQQARKDEGRDIGGVDGIIGQKTWAILWE